MKDVTNPKHQPNIRWSESHFETLISYINENQEDYVELLKCNVYHWVLRGWYVEAHYPSENYALRDLSRFLREDVRKSIEEQGIY